MKNSTRKRKRESTSLAAKLGVVQRYENFVLTMINKPEKTYDPYDYDDDKLRSEKSVQSFIEIENRMYWENQPLEMANVFKWLKANERGDFKTWGKINDLTKPNARSKQILRHLNEEMDFKFPLLSELQKLEKSICSPDRYGVVARKAIPLGTFLGFMNGELYTDELPSGLYAYTLKEKDNSAYVDCSSDFYACYARYYNRSTLQESHNVSVVRLPNPVDHNHAVCFVSNKHIQAGCELIIACDQGYVRDPTKTYKRYKTDPCFTSLEEVIKLAEAYEEKLKAAELAEIQMFNSMDEHYEK